MFKVTTINKQSGSSVRRRVLNALDAVPIPVSVKWANIQKSNFTIDN